MLEPWLVWWQAKSGGMVIARHALNGNFPSGLTNVCSYPRLAGMRLIFFRSAIPFKDPLGYAPC